MKKVLITLMVALSLLFALTLVASAEKVTYEGKEIELVNNLGDPSWYTGYTALAIQDKESIVILKDSEGNMTAYPAYYFFKYNIGLKDGNIIEAYIKNMTEGIDYSFVNEKTGKSWASGSMYYVEIPYGTTKCANNDVFGRDKDASGQYEPNIVEIVIPDSVTKIETQAFRRMVSCEKITMSKNITTIADWAFCGSTKLSTIVFPEGSALETVGNSFAGCTSLTSFDFSKVPNLVKLGSAFSSSGLTGPVDLSMLENLEEISGTFQGCAITKVTLPDTLEVIGDDAFSNCTNMYFASDYLPTSLIRIGSANGGSGHFLKNCKNVNSTLYFPAGLTEISSQYNFEGTTTATGTPLNLVFLGKMTTVRLDGGRMSNWSSVKITFYFAQNTASEMNGRIVQGYTDTNGQKYYLCCDGDKNAIYTDKTDGTLTFVFDNNDPNNETSYTPSTGSDGNRYNKINDGSPSFVFCGGDSVEQIFWARNGATTMGYNIFYTTPYSYDMNAHTTKDEHFCSRTQVQKQNCGYDGIFDVQCIVCDKLDRTVTPATGNHIYTVDSDCTTAHNCTVCEKLMIEALEHVLKDIIKYENGYMAAGTCTSTCTNEGCEHSAAPTEVAALFVNKGYTKDETENGSSLAYGISINKAAIEAYEKASGEVVTYGFIIGAVPDAPTGNLVSANGEILLAGAVAVNLTEIDYSKYSIYNVKLTSITTDNQKALDIYFNAYAIVEGKVRYFGEEETETAVTISYNSIK